MATIYDPSAKPDLVTVDSPYEESKIYKNTENVTIKLAESDNTAHMYGMANVPAKIYHTPDSGLTIAIMDGVASMPITEDIAAGTSCILLISGPFFDVVFGHLVITGPTAKVFHFNGSGASIDRFATTVPANSNLTLGPKLIGVK